MNTSYLRSSPLYPAASDPAGTKDDDCQQCSCPEADRSSGIDAEHSRAQANRGVDIIYAGPIGHLVRHGERCIGAVKEEAYGWYGVTASGKHTNASSREDVIDKLMVLEDIAS